MSEHQPHTPLDDLVLRMHIHFGAANIMGDDYSADDFADVIRILENMPAKMAAAEQRGAAQAVKAIRKLADENRGYEWLHPEDHLNELADQMEGDDETH